MRLRKTALQPATSGASVYAGRTFMRVCAYYVHKRAYVPHE